MGTRTRVILSSVFLALAIPLSATAFDFGIANGWKATIRGFVALDVDRDQSNLGGSEPLFPPRNNSPQHDQETFRFSANQTQLGFGIEAPPVNDLTIGGFTLDGLTNRGYVELDFLNSLAERRNTPTPRLRHAYWTPSWNEGKDSVLLGQTTVLFGDLLPDTTFDNLSLALGGLFGREPQVRYTHVQPLATGSDLTYAASINAPSSGLFNDTTDAAERSGAPFVHAKIAYHTDALGKADYFGFEKGAPVPLELAVSAFYGNEQIDRQARGGTANVDAWGVAGSVHLPIIGIKEGKSRAGALSLHAQGWYGRNLDSYFGGVGQGVLERSDGRVETIRGEGFFAGAKYFVTNRVWLNAIYSFDENDTDDFDNFRIAGGLFRGSTFGRPGVNEAQTVNVTAWYQVLDPLYIGVGWDYREAEYNDGQTGDNNRVNVSLFYNF